MEKIKFDLIDEICEKQDFDELILKILTSDKKNRINKILQDIDKNENFDDELKKKLYKEIFNYVEDANNLLKDNLKYVFSIAAKTTITKINSEIIGGNIEMSRKIKVVIADDNTHICKFIKAYLENYKDVEILGVANTDEDEIKMIEELKPEIVITDLMRNNKYTGLDIIKDYFNKKSKVEFLVISADFERDVIIDGLKVAGYIKKPFNDYEIIYNELKRIKREINDKEYKEWDEKYHNLEVIDVKKHLSLSDRRILKKLGIKVKNKIYTEYEFECLTMDLLAYYDDPEMDLSEEEKKYQKSLDGTNVSREEYNEVLNKLQKINENF